MATTLDDYREQFSTVRFRREDGILEMMFHTDGDSLRWGAEASHQMQEAFGAVADDPHNRIVIITGAGDEFNGPKGTRDSFPNTNARAWEGAHHTVRRLLMNFLNIEAPVIAAINGPVYRHCETPLLADIVLAADTVVFQDSGHFVNGLVPGDGMHIVTQALMGPNRARYFMLTGQELDAVTAKEYGLVNEILPAGEVLGRAWELARELNRQSPLVLRYTKVAFVHELRQRILAGQGYGTLLEGMAAIDDSRDAGGYELGGRF